ncbi:LacI family DNA-binding transcriptional regulator [Actinospica sp. MGRD01-02]|uniref:LacI family DNA-binding transcriptional regulator n=1 Tax=Actinospica acidithermotolerans TaxID=2828514 RepID=A0A941IJ93_9ACTN|nr:LacI family DNA-binding transcriptional regulator [Actinospica acidithermotolerans]MBR7829199.1 LacI family DNA-binding transcriptional regulator [Actinospica acidithermotolerans]
MSETPPARVTLAEVAASAGVSVGTASKALNDRGSMREETRARVRAAAERLGFQIDAVARSLQTGRSYTVGMITTDSIGRFSIPVMLGVEDTLGAGQMSVLLCDARDDRIREQYYLKTLLSRRVDGIIVTGRRTDPRPPLAQRPPVPVVYAFMQSADPEDCSVVPDEADGARRAVTHLLDIGRRRVALVAGPERHHSARTRMTSALDTLQDAGSPGTAGGDVPEPLYGEWSEAWGRQAARILLRRDPDLDAVFCASDQIARGLVDAMREAGKRVPRDVAVVGFDDWDVMTAASRPPLTSVDMDLEGLGRQAAELLLSAIDGHPRSGVHLHPCRLTIRASTAADDLD